MTDAINLFDLGVILIIGLSALLSFFRGFMREVLSLGSWVGASILTLIALPTVTKFVEGQVKSGPIASAIASIGTFLIALVLISIVTNMLVKFVKTGLKIGLFDNLLGLMFGVVRGALIVSICYFIMSIVIAEKDYPDWIKNAKTRPHVEKAAKEIAKITTNSVNSLTKKGEEPTDEESKKRLGDDSVDEMIKKLDKMGDKASEKADDAAKKIEQEVDEKSSSIPSMEDLQRRIKEENAKYKRDE